MEAILKVTKTITLIINEDEALWLKDLVQNSIVDTETYYDRDIRYRLWDALTQEGVGL